MKKSKLILCKRICGIFLSLALIFSLSMPTLAGDMVEMAPDTKALEMKEGGSFPHPDNLETELEPEFLMETEREVVAESDAEFQTWITTDDDSEFDSNWVYEVYDSDQTILLYRYIGDDTDVVVPAKVDIEGKEYSVIVCALGQIPVGGYDYGGAFDNNKKITSVQFMAGSRIRRNDMRYAFAGCENLRSVRDIPEDVTLMLWTFYTCSSLTTVSKLPQNVDDIAGIFQGCSSLITAPEIPQGVTDMVQAFTDCSRLTEAPKIPQSVTNMLRTFYNCSSLTQAPEIPSGVTMMGSAFSGCSKLVQAPDIPSGVTDMEFAFYDCNNLAGELTINLDTRNGNIYFDNCFYKAATSGSGLTVNYSSSCTRIDDIIATKGPDSKITKGRNVDSTPPPTDTYTITFDTNGGSEAPAPITATSGKPYGTLPTPTRENYQFKGWYTSRSGGNQIMPDTTMEIGKDHTLYARWGGKAYNVAFDAAGGNLNVKTKTAIYGEAYGTLPTPTRQHYEFLGWYTGKSGGSRVTSEAKVLTGGNHTLYARWIGTVYKVYYNANGGKSSTKSKLVNYGSTYGELSAPVRKGYKFKGWYTAKKGGKRATSTTKLTTAKNVALYARWDKISVKRVASIQLKNKKSKQMAVTVKRVKGAKGYQIVYGLNKSVTKGEKSLLGTSTKFTISKLKKGRTYYVKVRGYELDSAGRKVYGKYSTVKSLKIRK